MVEAAAITGIAADEIIEGIDGDKFHFQITGDDRFLICVESVFEPNHNAETNSESC